MGSAALWKEYFTLHACFEVIRFLCSQLFSCGLGLDLQTWFLLRSGISCIYWISSALSSLTQRSVHLSIWLTACGDQASELFTARLFALPLRYMEDTRLWGKVNGELHGPLSVTNAATAQSLEHVVLSRAVLAVSAYCLQHLTIQHEASCSSVKSTGPQKCDIVLCGEKDELVDYVTKHNCQWCIAIWVFFFFTTVSFTKAFFFFLQFFTAVWSGALILHVHTIWKGTLW